jgi:uncharacterized protein YjbJ (UPF0337 family)
MVVDAGERIAARGSDGGHAQRPAGAGVQEAMSWSAIEAKWDEYKVAAKRRWDRLSEQQLHGMRGNREYLSKRVQEAYSITPEEAERQLSGWQAQLLIGKPAGSPP